MGLTEVGSISELLKYGKIFAARKAYVEAYAYPSLRGKSLEPDLAYVGSEPTPSRPQVRMAAVFSACDLLELRTNGTSLCAIPNARNFISAVVSQMLWLRHTRDVREMPRVRSRSLHYAYVDYGSFPTESNMTRFYTFAYHGRS